MTRDKSALIWLIKCILIYRFIIHSPVSCLIGTYYICSFNLLLSQIKSVMIYNSFFLNWFFLSMKYQPHYIYLTINSMTAWYYWTFFHKWRINIFKRNIHIVLNIKSNNPLLFKNTHIKINNIWILIFSNKIQRLEIWSHTMWYFMMFNRFLLYLFEFSNSLRSQHVSCHVVYINILLFL